MTVKKSPLAEVVRDRRINSILEDIRPGSFLNSGVSSHYQHASKIGEETPELLYFSFVTLTTVGYGDIVPATPAARSLAILEMLAGQLYLASLVARLVGILGRNVTQNDSRLD